MENLSFFDEQQTMENLNGVKDSKHLDVVKLNYESCESLTWQELFWGYNNLCAITYSSGIGFCVNFWIGLNRQRLFSVAKMLWITPCKV